MFAKLCAVILALGVVACSLLALRQSRLQAASELTQSQLRIQRLDERLWALRSEIASRVAPEALREFVGERSADALRAMVLMPLELPEDEPVRGATGRPRPGERASVRRH